MKYLKPAAGLFFAAGLIIFPETVLTAAQGAMHGWYTSVAPALFPFMALMPLLTCAESVFFYERLLGRWMRPVLNLPGAAAPAIVVSMLAGSPAGAVAAVRTCSAAGMTRSELERLVLCVCGLSPAFLITGVGAAMLGDPAAGRILLRAQVASQLILLICTRGTRPDVPLPERPPAWHDDAVRSAVQGILTVCGYMVVFSVAASVLGRFLRSEAVSAGVLALLDLPSGARKLSNLQLPYEEKLLLTAFFCGLGGVCIAAQNLSVCANAVRTKKYLLFRTLHGALQTAFTALFLHADRRPRGFLSENMPFFALTAAFFSVPALIFLEKNLFLNKRKFENMPSAK